MPIPTMEIKYGVDTTCVNNITNEPSINKAAPIDPTPGEGGKYSLKPRYIIIDDNR